MKLITHFQFDSDEAALLKRLEESESRLANFRERAVAAMKARGDEDPRSGWHALMKGGDILFDQFIHVCDYVRSILAVATEAHNPDPAVAAETRRAVEELREACDALNDVMRKAVR